MLLAFPIIPSFQSLSRLIFTLFNLYFPEYPFNIYFPILLNIPHLFKLSNCPELTLKVKYQRILSLKNAFCNLMMHEICDKRNEIKQLDLCHNLWNGESLALVTEKMMSLAWQLTMLRVLGSWMILNCWWRQNFKDSRNILLMRI